MDPGFRRDSCPKMGKPIGQTPAFGRYAAAAVSGWRFAAVSGRLRLRHDQRRVVIRRRVAFDLFAQPVQEPVIGDQLAVRLGDFPDTARIEDQRVFARQAGAALRADLAPEKAALQRVHLLLLEDEIELQDVVQQPHRLHAGSLGAAEHALDMLGRVIEVERLAIEFLPFRVAHHRMVRGDVLQIVFVHVGVHPHPGLVVLLVVLRARQRRQDEEFEHIDRQFVAARS